MSRSFDATSLVNLPPLDARGAVALGSSLAAAARGKSLPKPVRAALEPLARATKALESALAAKNTPADVRADRGVADRDEDAAWSALRDWLDAWSRVPGAPQAKDAARVLAAVFPDGLAFTQLRYPLEWAEADARLKRLDGDGAKSIAALGGQPLLDALHRAHEAYGKALGVTQAAPPPPATVDIRTPLDAFATATRRYVLQVAASVDESKADSVALVDALLAPLTSWPTNRHGPGAATSPTENAAPAAPPAAPPDPTAAKPTAEGA